MENILFIGSTHMNIYMDIIAEMEQQGYSVDFISEPVSRKDPDNVRCYTGIRKLLINRNSFEKSNRKFWEEKLSESQYDKPYDILFVLDGQSIHENVFIILRERNKHLFAVNYLFDTTEFVYHFEKHFKYFDRIFTFDYGESVKYNINFLPNFWVPVSDNQSVKYKFFAFGSYDNFRYKVFDVIRDIAKDYVMPSYIRIKVSVVKWHKFKCLIKRILGIKINIPEDVYVSDMTTFDSLSPADFRAKIKESEIIVDTAAPGQDGLSPRFMWALGAEKKILTTNRSVEQYDFYDTDQIYIVEDVGAMKNDKALRHFIEEESNISGKRRAMIASYRLDNWIKTLIG